MKRLNTLLAAAIALGVVTAGAVTMLHANGKPVCGSDPNCANSGCARSNDPGWGPCGGSITNNYATWTCSSGNPASYCTTGASYQCATIYQCDYILGQCYVESTTDGTKSGVSVSCA